MVVLACHCLEICFNQLLHFGSSLLTSLLRCFWNSSYMWCWLLLPSVPLPLVSGWLWKSLFITVVDWVCWEKGGRGGREGRERERERGKDRKEQVREKKPCCVCITAPVFILVFRTQESPANNVLWPLFTFQGSGKIPKKHNQITELWWRQRKKTWKSFQLMRKPPSKVCYSLYICIHVLCMSIPVLSITCCPQQNLN